MLSIHTGQRPSFTESLTFDPLRLKGAQHNRGEEVHHGSGKSWKDGWMRFMITIYELCSDEYTASYTPEYYEMLKLRSELLDSFN